MSGAVFPLEGNQLAAANPRDNVWMTASAGTGKTQVLSARVLRLLLTPGVAPSQILCLTFTKAGAAEMANRINAVLARWVRLDPERLARELGALGADIDPATQDHARSLFASVLDCPGGGLRIDTIHAFAQWLLANFPEEAELVPGTRPMEDRERDLLARDVLEDMLGEDASDFADKVAAFSKAKSPEALRAWLLRCAGAAHMWEGPGSWQPPMDMRVRALLDMPASADADWAIEGLHRDTFPDDQLRAMLPLMRDWPTQAGVKTAAFIERWLGLPHTERVDAMPGFYDTVLKKDGEPRTMTKPARAEPRLTSWQADIAQAAAMVEERRALLSLATFLTDALTMGRAFALRWEEAKRREGFLDFDDLIARAALLLKRSDAADWIRYKLDRSFDHILIDEAQDTNAAQWDIVLALIDDFFSGEGARGDTLRTIFTVGDYKQAIFGFQGTSPENFERARETVRRRIEEARTHAHELREDRRLPRWSALDLGRSFRTALPVLHFVNEAIAAIGHDAFGLTSAPGEHVGEDRAGLVALWEPVTGESDLDENEEERDWLPAHDTQLAERIARQVRRWVSGEEPFVLEKGERRHAQAGDIMVLVRKRKDLAAQIVAKLHGQGVPVAGVDRLRLGAPLAVKDLMAALRFAAQPLDDLSLANVLASPLGGWTQDDLLAHVPRPPGRRLWEHLRERAESDDFVANAVSRLKDLLARADFETPQALLAWLLTGPWQGRRALTRRLGQEANDPIDELVNAAFAYERAHPPSLAGFTEWFDAGTGELKRDADAAGGQVRVMTVHGAKGLQAPIVILADATGEPGQTGALDLDDDPLGEGGKTTRAVPLPSLAKAQRVGRVAAAEERAARAAMEEHWRLLYVAMTRAEEALFIGGSLGPRSKGEPHEDSWYARLAPLFDSPPQQDDIWHERREWGVRADPIGEVESASEDAEPALLPDWASRPIGPEPRPPRPLAPSGAGEEASADPPSAGGGNASAAQRGVLLHRLLERLPDLPPEGREDTARAWLTRQAGDMAEAERKEMLESALAVVSDPRFADIFDGSALAEVPLAATLGGMVIAGVADRLLVTQGEVTVVDFKTTRRPPTQADEVPLPVVRQMAAYVAAVGAIYPGRRLRAFVLYTHAPAMFEIAPDRIALHKQSLGDEQDNYAPLDIE
ncbi:double-strand break repair helicase AddA [Erythrobacter sp.]|jgi:ATP-dependent helicase/nuclease subunit A|uniref:double-strand break repair helicase AddA n=1 Tax=Erythrobacter sp. TaxID=1042 RepID=UPI002EBB43DE|nr:double-strand break repair helicase AddA [Erythrobacter sp.]